MLSTDCLGTQEPHLICTLKKSLRDPHPQETTFYQTSRVSALLNRQYGKSAKFHKYTVLDLCTVFEL